MDPSNIRFAIFLGAIVVVVLIACTTSVLNGMTAARKARYLAQVCRDHGPAQEDPKP
jgi:hypothetical protein